MVREKTVFIASVQVYFMDLNLEKNIIFMKSN